MPMCFSDFLFRLSSEPALAITVGLLLAVMLVNGWTDAPNAIATAVVTRALTYPRAVVLAAVCNLLGVICVTAFNASVAETVYSIADFGPDSRAALTALCAAMAAIVIWAALAWRFGIPTSESHALTAGVTGAAVALRGGFSNICGSAWACVLIGLVISIGLGCVLGAFSARHMGCHSEKFYRRGQIFGAAGMAFLHGAQDGQKFMGVFLLGCALAEGRRDTETLLIPPWLMILCALTMALGTAMGGRRIVETIGRATALSPRLGLAADLGGGACLFLCTLLGLPVSTTHAKTAAILGAGGHPDRGIVRSLLLAWAMTFPCCGFIGYFTARGFLMALG